MNVKKIIFSSDNGKFEICRTLDYKTDHVSHGNRYIYANSICPVIKQSNEKDCKKNKKGKTKKKWKIKYIKNIYLKDFLVDIYLKKNIILYNIYFQ